MNVRIIVHYGLCIMFWAGLSNNLIASSLPLDDIDIKTMVGAILANRVNPSERLKECYAKLNQPGVTSLSLGEILQIMPELVDYAITSSL